MSSHLRSSAAVATVKSTLKGKRMKVQVNTSNDIENKDALEGWASEYLNQQLARFEQDITSIEVQMTDENHSPKGGGIDKRCMMEARVNGHAPIAVTNYAPDQNLAFRGAADKLSHALDHAFGKLDRREHRVRDTIRRDPEVLVPPQS
jgi:ribosome-associated translation inhibitor RaiA